MATILVVDDRAANREVARMTLDDGGHHVVEAAEGAQALDLARRIHPDLVLADVVMPGIDGYEFVQRLRADTATAGIPVVLYTANYRPEEAAPLASAYGANQIISKSADPEQLLIAVEQALHASPLPPHSPAPSADHLRTVNAKLVEKVLALDESEARFGALADVSPVGIVTGDNELSATYVNPRLADITGLTAEDLLGPGWMCCLPAGERARLRRDGVPRAQTALHGDVTLADHRRRWLHTTIRPITDDNQDHTGFVATIDDVTALIEAEQRRHADEREREAAERRRIAERFESLARLSGAVAHDFNNILNIILSFSEFIQDELRDAVGAPLDAARAAPMLDDLGNIHRAGKRAAHLAHQLLTFGGREIVQPVVINPNAVVDEVRAMIDSSIGRQITVSVELDPDAGNVVVDSNQLSQVLLNLAVNARDAMPHGGHLALSTRHLRTAEVSRGLPPGEYVHIAVRDDGEGMPPDVVDRAIEPFFTTRPKGHGTGLGLATAYGIMRQASGDLLIESAPGEGTTINLYLPATDEAAPAPVAPASVTADAGRTVLVADDEDGVREVAARILTRAGYHVLRAANGQEALDLTRTHAGPIDVVLSDVVMPHMNGPELAAALREDHPGLPVLYMSGYADPLMSEQGIVDGGVTVVGKPFTTEELLSAVAGTLLSIDRS
ncbi:hybrid sensor histidine kinase/response regulator [Actinoplanes missouriensis]|nr:response regulator [Actinoplanes missouriensis]